MPHGQGRRRTLGHGVGSRRNRPTGRIGLFRYHHDTQSHTAEIVCACGSGCARWLSIGGVNEILRSIAIAAPPRFLMDNAGTCRSAWQPSLVPDLTQDLQQSGYYLLRVMEALFTLVKQYLLHLYSPSACDCKQYCNLCTSNYLAHCHGHPFMASPSHNGAPFLLQFWPLRAV